MNGNNASPILRWAERAAFGALALLAIVPAGVAFTESYRGLYEWAIRHNLTGFWALIWPAQVDVFIAAGELALFVAIVRRWHRRDMIGAAAVTAIGLAVSVAGNVGHLASADWMSRATAAVPPLAAAAALAIGLAVLKKVTAPVTRRVTPRVTAWRPDPVTKITADEHCAPKTALLVQRRERAAVKAAFNGGAPHE